MSVRYYWWVRWWDKLVGRKSVNIKPEGYKAVCAACLETIDAKTTKLGDINTFSLGHAPDTAFAFGVITLCEEHRELEDPLDILLYRAVQIYQARQKNVGS